MLVRALLVSQDEVASFGTARPLAERLHGPSVAVAPIGSGSAPHARHDGYFSMIIEAWHMTSRMDGRRDKEKGRNADGGGPFFCLCFD
jgi:hypothetical protein